MTGPNSLAPAYTQLLYHSAFAPHIMTRPLKGIVIDTVTPVNSEVDVWAGGTVPWTDMIDSLVVALKAAVSSSVVFDRALLFSKPTEEDIPVLIAQYDVGVPGTVSSPGWQEATELTVNMKTVGNSNAKLTLLDFASGGLFTKTITLSGSGLETIFGEMSDTGKGWSGRDNTRIAAFVSGTRTLNEKLRRAYHLG